MTATTGESVSGDSIHPLCDRQAFVAALRENRPGVWDALMHNPCEQVRVLSEEPTLIVFMGVVVPHMPSRTNQRRWWKHFDRQPERPHDACLVLTSEEARLLREESV